MSLQFNSVSFCYPEPPTQGGPASLVFQSSQTSSAPSSLLCPNNRQVSESNLGKKRRANVTILSHYNAMHTKSIASIHSHPWLPLSPSCGSRQSKSLAILLFFAMPKIKKGIFLVSLFQSFCKLPALNPVLYLSRPAHKHRQQPPFCSFPNWDWGVAGKVKVGKGGKKFAPQATL